MGTIRSKEGGTFLSKEQDVYGFKDLKAGAGGSDDSD